MSAHGILYTTYIGFAYYHIKGAYKKSGLIIFKKGIKRILYRIVVGGDGMVHIKLQHCATICYLLMYSSCI